MARVALENRQRRVSKRCRESAGGGRETVRGRAGVPARGWKDERGRAQLPGQRRRVSFVGESRYRASDFRAFERCEHAFEHSRHSSPSRANRVRNRTIGNSIFPTWLFGVPEKRKTIKIGDGRSDDSGGKFTQKMKKRDFHSIEFQ